MLRRIAVFLLLCVPSGKCRAETLSQLITDVRVLTRDGSSSTRQRFTDAQYQELINQGQREAISATKCIVKSYQFQLAAGTTYYSLPSDFISVTRVVRGKYGSMQELSPAALDGRTRGWENAAGTPTYYFINFSSRGLVGFATFPGTATDTDTIKVEYNAQAADLSASTDVPFNGIAEMYDYHHGLAYFAAAIASAVDGLSAQSSGFMTMYNGVVAGMKSTCKDRVNYLPSAGSAP